MASILCFTSVFRLELQDHQRQKKHSRATRHHRRYAALPRVKTNEIFGTELAKSFRMEVTEQSSIVGTRYS